MAKTILLADDSVTIQKVVELTFLDQDYKVIAVSDGNSALVKLAEMRPDILIADVHMPATNGYRVTRQAKERYSDLPVLLLVGTFEPFDEKEAQACGADGFLKKPFDSQDLLREVERCIGLADAAPAMEASSFEEDSLSFDDSDQAAFQGGDELDDLDTGPLPVATPSEDAPFELEAAEVSLSQDDDLFTESFAEPPLEDPSFDEPMLDEPPLEYLDDEPEVTAEASEDAGVLVEAQAPPPPRRAVPAAAASPAAASSEVNGQGSLSDEDVDRIARRVVELIGDSSVREVAWEIVPDLAEVIIKERIRELESQVE